MKTLCTIKQLGNRDSFSYSYEGFGRENFAGNFGTENSKWATHIIYNLDEIDQKFVADVKLKDCEKIFRCDTEMCRRVGIKYLVKINFDKCLVYFISEKGNELDEPIFETKGVQIGYLNIMNYY